MSIRFTRVARILTVLAASTTLLASPAAVGSPSGVVQSGVSTSCSVHWGSTAKSADEFETGIVQGLRAGRHTCFDRLVIDMSGEAPGYSVRYVTAVRQEGSGQAVPVAGGARLAVVAEKGATFVPGMPSVNGFDTFRQVRWAGSFEGQTQFALGVRARLPFRTFVLNDSETHSSRLVIDVAHRW